MKLRFYASVGLDGITIKDRVKVVAEALKVGAKNLGDEVEIVHNGEYSTPAEDVDVACCWGIMGNAKDIVSGYRDAGKRVLMFDKAMIRRLGNDRQGHYRVGMDGPSPLKYLMRTFKSWERWEEHRIDLRPRQIDRLKGSILFAGSSQKYCDFYNLGNANDYAESVFNRAREVRRKTRLVYRPKPSWPGFREIAGTTLSGSDESLMQALSKADLLITHGSAAAFEAIVSGIPAITLGPGVTRPVSSDKVEDINDPPFPSVDARFHYCCQVAWAQWTAEELASGEAWSFLREELRATA